MTYLLQSYLYTRVLRNIGRPSKPRVFYHYKPSPLPGSNWSQTSSAFLQNHWYTAGSNGFGRSLVQRVIPSGLF